MRVRVSMGVPKLPSCLNVPDIWYRCLWWLVGEPNLWREGFILLLALGEGRRIFTTGV